MVNLTKRSILGAPLVAALGAAGAVSAQVKTEAKVSAPAAAAGYDLPMANGPFQSSVSSLQTYQTPDWFRDAKFGIWSHWGPQAVPRAGDWYARYMYVPGHWHYDQHLKKYGHPSKFGFKDIFPLWTAESFDPEKLMDLYQAAGAKYFVSMGVHHDNFDLWNSKHHRWNATAIGPKRDIVGAWQAAARKRGLRFGVSEHLGASHNWLYPSHLYDQFWPEIGVSYDGADPQYADLYHPLHDEPYKGNAQTWYTKDPKFHQIWYNRIQDLIDSYEPDLLYSDGGLPFGEVGRSLVAHFYNKSATRQGRTEAVYNCKDLGSGEFYKDAFVQDVERGVLKGINPLPWQTCTSNGDWFYSDGFKYKTGTEIVHMLADIVSKNGNLLLNIVQYADGSLPPESQQLAAELAEWMKVNAEAIHGTRPWNVFGEGPTQAADGAFQEGTAYTNRDIRFTTRGQTLYAIILGKPGATVSIASLGRKAVVDRHKLKEVRLLGAAGKCAFKQGDTALTVTLPSAPSTDHAVVLKITFET